MGRRNTARICSPACEPVSRPAPSRALPTAARSRGGSGCGRRRRWRPIQLVKWRVYPRCRPGSNGASWNPFDPSSPLLSVPSGPYSRGTWCTDSWSDSWWRAGSGPTGRWQCLLAGSSGTLDTLSEWQRMRRCGGARRAICGTGLRTGRGWTGSAESHYGRGGGRAWSPGRWKRNSARRRWTSGSFGRRSV